MRILKTAIFAGIMAVLALPGLGMESAAKPTPEGSAAGEVLAAVELVLPLCSAEALFAAASPSLGMESVEPLCSEADSPPMSAAASSQSCDVTIDCEDDTTRSCTDTTSPFSCLGQHQNCNADIRGYVQCNGGPKQYCPPCPDCTRVKQCNPCGGAPPQCGCICVQGACGRIDAWMCL